MGKKINGDDLTLKQKKFCELFASDKEFLGNGTQSYIEAFDVNTNKPGQYNKARANASKLLAKSNILSYINKILEEMSLNEANADKQLAFLMSQQADFGSKLGAIREFNALKQRIQKKIDHTGEIKFVVNKY